MQYLNIFSRKGQLFETNFCYFTSLNQIIQELFQILDQQKTQIWLIKKPLNLILYLMYELYVRNPF